jgi:hypothetical protein
MYRHVAKTLILLAGACAISALSAQDISQYTDFTVLGKTFQVHGFLSQGFAYTDGNNWLTMPSDNGSFAMTDGGVNISTQLTDKLRVGAQVYDRNIGSLGQWHPELDWAYADYKFTSWFGLRGGKVKTTMGLYNDTQDMDFLRVFALLPQSVYPTDLRDSTIAHTGGDAYGTIGLKKAGSLQYTLFAGQRQDTMYGGYIYMLQQVGINYTSYGGLQYGADLRWNTPLPGLLVGATDMQADITGTGTWTYSNAYFGGTGFTTTPTEEHSRDDKTYQLYGQYNKGNLTLDTEYRRYWRDQIVFNGMEEVETDVRAWYAAASYRLSKRIAIGTYYSRFANPYSTNFGGAVTQSGPQSNPADHEYDKVVALRYDLSNNWYLKVEEHFINGYGTIGMYPDGFYTPSDTTTGEKPKTAGLIVRTGWNF